MKPEFKDLPFDELRTLHREVGALIAQRRHEALEDLKQQIAVLGFSVEDLVPKKRRGKAPATPRYRNPDASEDVWSGRGKPPAWMQELLDQGRDKEEFAVNSSA